MMGIAQDNHPSIPRLIYQESLPRLNTRVAAQDIEVERVDWGDRVDPFIFQLSRCRTRRLYLLWRYRI